jgi:hypothetical protein
VILEAFRIAHVTAQRVTLLCRPTSIIFHTDAPCSATEVQKPARGE